MLCLHITRYAATAAMKDSLCLGVCVRVQCALCEIFNSSAAVATSIVHRTNQTECEVDPMCLKYKSKLRIRSHIYFFFFIISHGWLFLSLPLFVRSLSLCPSLAIFHPRCIFFVVLLRSPKGIEENIFQSNWTLMTTMTSMLFLHIVMFLCCCFLYSHLKFLRNATE